MGDDVGTEQTTDLDISSKKGFTKLILTICGISEVKQESQIEIPIEKRRTFLTESSGKVRYLNKTLAIVLIATIAFLIGYYK